MADLNEILQLLEDQDNGTLSGEGRQVLDNWGNESPENRALIEGRLSIEFLHARIKETIRQRAIANKEKLWQKIQDQGPRRFRIVGIDPPQTSPGSGNRSLIIRLLIPAAAAAVLLIIAFVWYWKTPGKNNAAIADHAEPHRPSIIYNDRAYDLDSVPDEDTVLRAENWAIIKSDKKHIVYCMTGSRADKQQNPAYIPMTIISIPYDKDTSGWQISLADGTRAVLYHGSLSLPLKDSADKPLQRNVAPQGYAYFDVSPDPNHPFRASLPDGGVVDVIGTFFGINSEKKHAVDSIELFSGEVIVKNHNNSVQLRAGQIALLDRSTTKIDTMKLRLCRDSLPWKKDKFDFSSQRLCVAMERVRRWYNMKEVIYSPGVDTLTPGRLSGGRLDKDLPLARLLKMIEDNTTGIHFRIRDRTIYVETK